MRKKKKRTNSILKELTDKLEICLFFFSLLIGVFGGVFVILWLSFSPLLGQDLSLADFSRTKSYGAVSNSWQDSEFVESLAYLCSLKNSGREQVFCVYHFLDENIEYGPHHIGTNILIKSPEKMINSSLCRDVSVLVCSVAKKMGFECSFIYSPGHVYSKVITKDYICVVDVAQQDLFCYSKGDEERISLNITKSL